MPSPGFWTVRNGDFLSDDYYDDDVEDNDDNGCEIYDVESFNETSLADHMYRNHKETFNTKQLSP